MTEFTLKESGLKVNDLNLHEEQNSNGSTDGEPLPQGNALKKVFDVIQPGNDKIALNDYSVLLTP